MKIGDSERFGEIPRHGSLRFSPSCLRFLMNLYALKSKETVKNLAVGVVIALLLSAVLGLNYQWSPAPATTRPDSELAGLDATALMAEFRVQPLDQIPVPDFKLKNLDGNLVNMASFRGKVVLLNIWATW